MTVEVRAAEPADIPALLKLLGGLARYEKLSHRVAIDETRMARFVFGPDRVAEALLALQNGVPAGYALFYPVFPSFRGLPWLYLEDLYVDGAARGSGIGKALMARLARIAVERGWAAMAWGVLDWNAPAFAFYESLGAVRSSLPVQMELTGADLERLAQLDRPSQSTTSAD